jgi:threonine aldolase
MRQVGVVAAAGLYALEQHVPLLALDNARAARLASVIDATDGLATTTAIETNLVFFRVAHNLARELQVLYDRRRTYY